MTSSTWQIKEAVQRALDYLPAEKIEEVLDLRALSQSALDSTKKSKTTVPESTELILHTPPAAHRKSVLRTCGHGVGTPLLTPSQALP